jgi:hypothetical protein
MTSQTYKLTRPFDDGKVVHPRGSILSLEEAPKSAKKISAKEIAAEKAKLSVAEDTVKAAERAELKAEIMAELAEAGIGGGDAIELAEAQEKLENELTELREALAEQTTKADEAVAEAKAANEAAAAAVTGGVDNDGEPLTDTAEVKAPVQKAGAKK